ncbi:MAG: class I SAM-dependent methyltransferase [Ardenticatenales bacterium]|nr:class I SAM-dependent methyltransferase [Ardenticatenales bacterium]
MCASAQATLLVEARDWLLHQSHEIFRLLTCTACGHIYQSPRPSIAGIDAYYPDDYLPFLRAIEDEKHWWKRLDRRYGHNRRCMTVHQAAGQVGRLLDVGCATGIFLDGMRRLGWQVVGVEPSSSAARYARERFGLPIFKGRLEETSFATGAFDVITLWDVLEHIHDPQQTLDEVARLLKPGGLLVFSVPNPDSLEAQGLGCYWAGWDLPRHLNLFRLPHLRQHLALRGLQIERVRSFMLGYILLIMSLEYRWRAEGRDATLLSRLLRSWPLRLLSVPYYAGPANWFNWSSVMVVFARRDTGEKQ